MEMKKGVADRRRFSILKEQSVPDLPGRSLDSAKRSRSSCRFSAAHATPPCFPKAYSLIASKAEKKPTEKKPAAEKPTEEKERKAEKAPHREEAQD